MLLRILIQVFSSGLLPAFFGLDLLATTEQSAISQPIDSAFSLLGLYLIYLVRACVKESTRLPSVICTFSSIHPDPNHVDKPCRSYPFPVFLQDMLSHKFPRFLGGSPYISATSGSLHSGLDFACRPFRFSFTGDTLPILLLSKLGFLLRLRHFKG